MPFFANRKLNFFVGKHCHQTINYHSFKHFDEQSFIQDLSLIPWEVIQLFNNVDEMVEIWNSLFLEVVNKHAPLKCHRIKRKCQPDKITPEILDHIKERNKCKINGNLDQYRILRNKITSLIKNSKQNVHQAEIENGKDDPRSIWKLFRNFGAKGQSQDKILGVKFNNNFTSDEKEIVDIFNTFFVNVASQFKEPIQISDFEKLKFHVNSKVNPDTHFSIPVRKFLSNLDTTKATALDCMGLKLLKIASNGLSSGFRCRVITGSLMRLY